MRRVHWIPRDAGQGANGRGLRTGAVLKDRARKGGARVRKGALPGDDTCNMTAAVKQKLLPKWSPHRKDIGSWSHAKPASNSPIPPAPPERCECQLNSIPAAAFLTVLPCQASASPVQLVKSLTSRNREKSMHWHLSTGISAEGMISAVRTQEPCVRRFLHYPPCPALFIHTPSKHVVSQSSSPPRPSSLTSF